MWIKLLQIRELFRHIYFNHLPPLWAEDTAQSKLSLELVLLSYL